MLRLRGHGTQSKRQFLDGFDELVVMPGSRNKSNSATISAALASVSSTAALRE